MKTRSIFPVEEIMSRNWELTLNSQYSRMWEGVTLNEKMMTFYLGSQFKWKNFGC
jgi:hypothetical protein